MVSTFFVGSEVQVYTKISYIQFNQQLPATYAT